MKRLRQFLAAVVLLGAGPVAAMPIGLRMVFWNNHSERSADIIVDAGGNKTVAVPRAWIAEYPALVAMSGGDAEESVRNGTAANGRKVWQCYVLGLDPERADDDFRITRFWMEENVPMFEYNHTTDGNGNSFIQWIRKMGATTPTGPWEEVPATGNPTYHFFKAEVALP